MTTALAIFGVLCWACGFACAAIATRRPRRRPQPFDWERECPELVGPETSNVRLVGSHKVDRGGARGPAH